VTMAVHRPHCMRGREIHRCKLHIQSHTLKYTKTHTRHTRVCQSEDRGSMKSVHARLISIDVCEVHKARTSNVLGFHRRSWVVWCFSPLMCSVVSLCTYTHTHTHQRVQSKQCMFICARCVFIIV